MRSLATCAKAVRKCGSRLLFLYLSVMSFLHFQLLYIVIFTEKSAVARVRKSIRFNMLNSHCCGCIVKREQVFCDSKTC
jgi:hypothetical protein